MSDEDIVECFYGGDYVSLAQDNPFIFDKLREEYLQYPERYIKEVEEWKKTL
jgi:hypothetical protein